MSLETRKLSLMERALLEIISSHERTPKVEDLAKLSGYEERGARYALRRFEERGWLEVTKKATPFTPAHYHLTPRGEDVLLGGQTTPLAACPPQRAIRGASLPPAVVNVRRIPVVGGFDSIAVDLFSTASCDKTVAEVGRGTGAREPQTLHPIPPMGTQDNRLPDQASPMVKSGGAERAKVPEEATDAKPQLRTKSAVLSQTADASPVAPGEPDVAREIWEAYPPRPQGVAGAGKTPLSRIRPLVALLSASEQQAVLASAIRYGAFWRSEPLDEQRYIKGLERWITERDWDGWTEPHRNRRECEFPPNSEGQQMASALRLLDLAE